MSVEETQTQSDPQSLARQLLLACGYTEQQVDADVEVLLDFVYRRQRERMFRKSQPPMLGNVGVGPCMPNPLRG